jgi:aryl-alcohol dehydrogenase-like predicted oxidoreductase
MEKRSLGGLQVSVVGLGCNQLGTTCDEAASASIVAAALDQGINFFDTADEYGDGRSEVVLGKALRGQRDQVFIATKFGSRLENDPQRQGASARWIAIAVEDSLRRLDTDYIDLYQMHFPDPEVSIEETLDALNRLVATGKVREIGCCNLSGAQIDAAMTAAQSLGVRPFASAQNRLNLLRQESLSDVVPACERHGLRLLPFFPLASGLLTGKYRRGQPPAAGSRLHDNVAPEVAARMLSSAAFDRLEALEAYAHAQGHSLAELAVAWLAAQPVIASVICGATRPAQVMDNVKGADWRLSSRQVAEVAALGRKEQKSA